MLPFCVQVIVLTTLWWHLDCGQPTNSKHNLDLLRMGGRMAKAQQSYGNGEPTELPGHMCGQCSLPYFGNISSNSCSQWPEKDGGEGKVIPRFFGPFISIHGIVHSIVLLLRRYLSADGRKQRNWLPGRRVITGFWRTVPPFEVLRSVLYRNKDILVR